MPMTMAALRALNGPTLEADVLEQRSDEGEREVAEDHGRDPGQHLERRLEDAAGALIRVLAEVDGRSEPEGCTHENRDERDQHRSRHERQDAEARLAEERRPLGSREVVPQGYLAKELDRRDEERDDDADRRRHGHEGAKGEESFDDILAPAPAYRF